MGTGMAASIHVLKYVGRARPEAQRIVQTTLVQRARRGARSGQRLIGVINSHASTQTYGAPAAAVRIVAAPARSDTPKSVSNENPGAFVHVVHDAQVVGLVVRFINVGVAHLALAITGIGAGVAGRATRAIGAGLIQVAVVPQSQVVSKFVHEGDRDVGARCESTVVHHAAERNDNVVAR